MRAGGAEAATGRELGQEAAAGHTSVGFGPTAAHLQRREHPDAPDAEARDGGAGERDADVVHGPQQRVVVVRVGEPRAVGGALGHNLRRQVTSDGATVRRCDAEGVLVGREEGGVSET